MECQVEKKGGNNRSRCDWFGVVWGLEIAEIPCGDVDHCRRIKLPRVPFCGKFPVCIGFCTYITQIDWGFPSDVETRVVDISPTKWIATKQSFYLGNALRSSKSLELATLRRSNHTSSQYISLAPGWPTMRVVPTELLSIRTISLSSSASNSTLRSCQRNHSMPSLPFHVHDLIQSS